MIFSASDGAKLIITEFSPSFNNLFTTLVFVFLIWYAKYHWNRRRFYQLAGCRKSAWPILPFIGHGWLFLGSNERILSSARYILSTFESPSPVWLGTRLFFAIHEPKHMEIVMNSPHALGKEDLYKYTIPFVGLGLFTASVPKWKRNRRIIMPTFNQRILDSFVEVFSEQAIILTNQLRKEAGNGTFDVFHYFSKFTLDAICETAMGIKVNAQTTDAEFVKWANKCMEISFNRMFAIYYHFDFIFNRTQAYRDLTFYSDKVKEFTANVVKQKRKEFRDRAIENAERPEALFEEGQPKRNTFLEQLIEISEGGEHLTDEDLRDEVLTALIGGSETTASVNSFVLIMLGMFPDIQEKAYQEIIDAVGLDKPIECADLPHLPYVEMVIKETMRIFPVGPVLVRSVTKDIDLGNAIVPAGTSAVFGIIETHRNPITWPDPMTFDPLRFTPEECAKRHPYSFLPFSGGPRNCVGFRYAYMAMKAVIATVVRKYKISTSYQSTEEIRIKQDLVLKPCDGYPISLEFRN